jgi:Family of unknown function (DUF6318)
MNRHALVVVPIVSLLALTACGGGTSHSPAALSPSAAATSAAPASSAPSSGSPSPTVATPSPVATTVPADVPTTGPNITKAGEKPPLMASWAQEDSPRGAIAFATFFIKTIDWAFATTNGSYMRHYFEYSCTSCRSVADGVDRSRKAGIRYIGDRFSNIGGTVTSMNPEANADVSVLLVFDTTGAESVDSKGKAVDAEPPHRGATYQAYLGRRSSGWTIVDFIKRVSG